MLSARTNYAIEHFIEKDYFEARKNQYVLKESAKNGASALVLDVDGYNLCVADFDHKKKCEFVNENSKNGMKKGVDHLLLRKKDNAWELHLIEMKTTVGRQTLKEIKQKFRASCLSAKALAAFLDISIEKIFLYTTFENEAFADETNPSLIKVAVGEKAIDLNKEWKSGNVKLNFGEWVTFPHSKIAMKRSKNGILVGGYRI